jgi:hypothetical protein
VPSARGRRELPPPRAPPAQELAERRLRALEEPLTVRPRPGYSFPVLEVRNPIHRTRYLTLFPRAPSEDGALCTCTDFARRGLGSCKHLAAALAWLQRHAEEVAAQPPVEGREAELWAEVDRRNAQLRQGPVDDPRELSRPGAVLYERRPKGRPPAALERA